jgi:hypothetical protein
MTEQLQPYERYKTQQRERYASDPEYRDRKRRYVRERWANDPVYRAAQLDRNRLWKLLDRGRRKLRTLRGGDDFFAAMTAGSEPERTTADSNGQVATS